jgi:hypothetical protein
MSRLEWWAVVVVAYLTVTAVVTVATGSEPRVADLIRALSNFGWPAAAVVIIVTLRRQIGDFLMRLAERAKRAEVDAATGKVTVDFTEIQAEAQTKVAALQPTIERLRERLGPLPPEEQS